MGERMEVGYDAGALDDLEFRYEGAEKTLEVHFAGSSNQTLRSLSRTVWDDILDYACCRILSKTSTESLDAYVLSESSLFVYDWRIYLKTCGKTTLLRCLAPLFRAAEEILGARAEWIRFSHKNFVFPSDQKFPHVSFDQETQFCLAACSSPLSSAHVLGDLLGDHWNVLYVDLRPRSDRSDTSPSQHVQQLLDHVPNTRSISSSSFSSSSTQLTFNRTDSPQPIESTASSPSLMDDNVDRIKENIVNIMMYGMDPSVAKHFYHGENETSDAAAWRATRESGIESLFDKSASSSLLFDPYMFSPCGYSLNVLISGEYYATIHITPEDEFSYASFETNVPSNCYAMLLRKVLDVFRPNKCTVALFSDYKRKDCLSLVNGHGEKTTLYKRVSHGSAEIMNTFFAEMSGFSRYDINSFEPTLGDV